MNRLNLLLHNMNVKSRYNTAFKKGYGWRPYTVQGYRRLKFVKEISPETICIGDNCYGEFVETEEPTAYGADLIAGSL